MSIDLGDNAKRERDRRLRREILRYLNAGRAVKRGLHGSIVVLEVESSMVRGLQFEDDTHFLQLLTDLSNKGLITIEEERGPGMRRRNDQVRPEHLLCKITDKGSMLMREEIEPDPDVHDERATD
jgi:hypothetical protein